MSTAACARRCSRGNGKQCKNTSAARKCTRASRCARFHLKSIATTRRPSRRQAQTVLPHQRSAENCARAWTSLTHYQAGQQNQDGHRVAHANRGRDHNKRTRISRPKLHVRFAILRTLATLDFHRKRFAATDPVAVTQMLRQHFTSWTPRLLLPTRHREVQVLTGTRRLANFSPKLI